MASAAMNEGAALKASKSAGDTGVDGAPALTLSLQTMTSAPGSLYGSGCSRTVLTTANIALLAPIPSASDATVSAAKSGARRHCRSESRTSFRMDSEVMLRLLLV